jgi:hypothetical protein
MALNHAIAQWRSRKVFPTEFSSAELRTMSREFRQRAVFSARMTNADAVKGLADVVDEILQGKIDMATGRLRLFRKLKQLGYDPAVGFPQDMADVPPAEAGSLRDLSSASRIDLMLETNVRMAQGYGRMVAGNTEAARYAFPAWELVRVYWRQVPRGSEESHSVGWQRRWTDAGGQAGRMIELKDSKVWQALGDGAGGYDDALGNPFPPFAFNSGFGWKAVPRAECVKLGLELKDEGKRQKAEGSLLPGDAEVADALTKLGPEFSKTLLDGLEDIARKGEDATRTARRREYDRARSDLATTTERREAHRAFVESLLPKEEAA